MNEKQEVVVTGIQMPFGSMVRFMFKWAAASVPALIVLFVVGFLASATIVGVIEAIERLR